MADSLAEFLVGLGFRIDEISWRRYTSYVALASKTTAELGSVAVETATAIEVSVAKVARQYETLYYVSARTGQSAQYIQSAQFAFRQMGLSADDATSAIEGVAAAMRLNPGLRGLFGGATKPEEIVDKLRGLPYFVAARMGQMAGLSEKTFQHLWMFGPQEKQAAEDHRKRLAAAGIDADKSALRFTQFGRTLNKLEDDFGILSTRIALDWVDPVEDGIKALDKAVQWINNADKATRGWILTLGSLGGTVGGSWVATALFKKLFGIGGGASAEITEAGATAGSLFGKGILVGVTRVFTLGALLYALYETIKPTAANANESGAWNKPLGGPGASGAGASGVAGGRMATGIQMLTDAGWSREAAIGIMSGLHSESGLDPLAFNPRGGGRGAQGVPQLRGDRIDEASRFLGKPWASASYEDQMRYIIWSMSSGSDFEARRTGQRLRAPGLGAGAASDIFLGGYERSGDAGELVRSRTLAERLSSSLPQQAGGDDRSTHISQTINFHGDAGRHLTVEDIRNAIRDGNQEAQRNVAAQVLR